MISVICFFLGVVLVASNNEIGLLFDNSYIPIICNFLGGLLMGISVYNFIKIRNKEVKYKRDVFEKLSLLSDSILENTRIYEEIEKLNSNQKESLGLLSEISNNFEDVSNYGKDNLCTKIFMDEKVESLINALQIIYKKIEESQNDVNEKLSDMKNVTDNIEKNKVTYIKNALEKVQHILEEIQSNNEMSGKCCDKINSIVSLTENIPEELCNQNEIIISTVREYTEDLKDEIENLIEDLEEQDRKRLKNFNNMISNITDYCENNNEEIGLLSKQYLEFEKTIEGIVNQMTEMSQKDIEVMKGFFNG